MAYDGDIYTKLHDMMILLHQSLKKGLDSLIKQLEDDLERIKSGKESLLKKDLGNWLNYLDAWLRTLGHHHETEDLFMFPPLKAAGIEVEVEVEAHKKIHLILDKLEVLVKEYKANPEKYSNGEQILIYLKEVEKPLVDHLNEEVSKLNKSTLSVIPVKEFEEIMRKGEEYGKAGPTFSMPFFLHHLNPKDTKTFLNIIEFPAFVSWIILPVFNLRHAALWRYAPYQLY